MPKEFKIISGYMVTENRRERTLSIYDRSGQFLSTVDDGELLAEIRRLEERVD